MRTLPRLCYDGDMTDTIHPAHTLSFDDLWDGLLEAHAKGFVYRRTDPVTRLQIFAYTPR